jgi:hypothetical protein
MCVETSAEDGIKLSRVESFPSPHIAVGLENGNNWSRLFVNPRCQDFASWFSPSEL